MFRVSESRRPEAGDNKAQSLIVELYYCFFGKSRAVKIKGQRTIYPTGHPALTRGWSPCTDQRTPLWNITCSAESARSKSLSFVSGASSSSTHRSNLRLQLTKCFPENSLQNCLSSHCLAGRPYTLTLPQVTSQYIC